MATASSSALLKRSTDTELMPPPPKRIKRPQKVLDEDTYTDAISEIIARDFFPGLLETETQQEYLDAVESHNPAWISSAHRRLTQVMTPGRKRGRRGTSIQTPMRAASDTPMGYGGETPMSVVSGITASSEVPAQPDVDTNMSLSAFQSKYTSEDNESFYKLLDKQNEKRAEEHAWIWRGNKLPSKMQIKQKDIEAKLLKERGTLNDDGGSKKSRLAIQDPRDKPAMPDAWKSKPNNTLMFKPDSIEDSMQTIAERAQLESRAAPKAVVYVNTRIPPEAPPALNAPGSPTLSAIRDAIAGHPRATHSESGFGFETPRVNGYAFVDDEPEPHELMPPPPLIELGKGDSIPNPFKIKEQSRREDLHHRMVDTVAQQKRNSAKVGLTGKLGSTPVPKFPGSPRVGPGGLTPAAHRFWSKVGKKAVSTPGSGLAGKSSMSMRERSGLRIVRTPATGPERKG